MLVIPDPASPLLLGESTKEEEEGEEEDLDALLLSGDNNCDISEDNLNRR